MCVCLCLRLLELTLRLCSDDVNVCVCVFSCVFVCVCLCVFVSQVSGADDSSGLKHADPAVLQHLFLHAGLLYEPRFVHL